MILCVKCSNYVEDSGLSCKFCQDLTSELDKVREYITFEESTTMDLRPAHSMALKLARMQLKRLEYQMERDYKKDGYSEYTTKQLKELVYTVEKLIKEGRALDKEQRQRADSMSLSDKIKHLLKFVTKLPEEKKREFLEETFKIVNGKAKAKNKKA